MMRFDKMRFPNLGDLRGVYAMQSDVKKANVSVFDWMGQLFLYAIPGVNIVMAVVWAITSEKKSKRNFAIAWLVWFVLIVLILTAVMFFFHTPILAWFAEQNTNFGKVVPQVVAATPIPTP